MRLVIFGLTVSSSWGNGHAPLWRGLLTALLRAGHAVTFFERDVPYYAEHRDLASLGEGGELVLYADWQAALPAARRALASADAAIVTSYCPDGIDASRLVIDSRVPVRCFYDLDTPVTLARLSAGQNVGYLPPDGLAGFDLVLSYTGGGALDALRERLGARRVSALYGSVDPDLHRPAAGRPRNRGARAGLGPYGAGAALDLPDATLARIARRARERALDEHSAGRRAAQLVALLQGDATATRVALREEA